MRRIARSAWRLAAGSMIAALFAACNNSTSPNSVVTQAEANAVAEVVATDVASLSAGATFDGSTGAPFAVGPTMGAPVMPTTTSSCTPTKSPASPTNSDGDPVPDSVRVDFAGCTFTNGSFTATLSGTIDFIDPTPTVTDAALKTRSTDFARSVTNTATGLTRSAVENGVRWIAGNADQISLADTLETDYTFATGATASHIRKWASLFTADQTGSIQMGSPLPSGNWSIAGSSTWTSGALSYALSAATTQPLHFNAGCTVDPRFDSGTLVIAVTKNNATSNVMIQFTACGQYTVTRS